MILYSDKRFITNSECPDTDWVGDADYILDDNDEKDAEIEEKIISMYPNFDFVLSDDETKIIDVVATEPIITEEQINECKNKRVAESKVKLAEWLATHPILFTDGKYYSVTEEKQALLNGNLASYERATKAGVEYPLKWNSTGEECTEWSYNDLLTLSLNIAAYVAPKVAIQQSIEIAIKECDTMDEIDAIVIDYDRNGDNGETNS